MELPVTMTIAGASALVLLWLSARVSAYRMKSGVNDGEGGDATLRARVRAQANLSEYAPVVLLLLALLELADRPPAGLWAAGALFVAGRLLHPFGLERPAPNPLRAGGILSTWAVLAGLAVWALLTAYGVG